MELVIVAGGPSVSEGINLGLWDKIKGKEIWSLNYSFKFMPYLPAKQLWVDTTFFKNNIKEIQTLHEKGVKLVCKESHRLYDNFKMIEKHEVCRTVKEANETKKLFIGEQGLVGLFALSYAIRMSYENIWLLGYDFGTTDIKDSNTHFYQQEFKNTGLLSSGVGRPSVYLDHKGSVKPSVKDFQYYTQFNCNIVNVSLTSNISTFKRIGYAEFLKL